MEFINHQSNGAKGLRVAASVCIVFGYVAVLFCIIAAFVADDVVFIVPILTGCGAFCVLYLIACGIRALASLAEAAQLYYNKNIVCTEEIENIEE